MTRETKRSAASSNSLQTGNKLSCNNTMRIIHCTPLRKGGAL